MYVTIGDVAMSMIRKQLYIAPEQQVKLRALAAEWNRTEAEIVRIAIDRLPMSGNVVANCLAEAGLLAGVPVTAAALPPEAAEQLERTVDLWVAAKPERLRISEAVMEDRR